MRIFVLCLLLGAASALLCAPSSCCSLPRLSALQSATQDLFSEKLAKDPAFEPLLLRPRPVCNVIDTSDQLTPYAEAWKQQKQILEQRLAPEAQDDPDCVLLVQHPAVYTLGTGSTLDHLKFDAEQAPFELFRVERGGEVTYHGPGQLVVYPIMNLRRYRQDVHWYLRALEETVIRTLAHFGQDGQRIEGLTGVWVNGAKVAAVGVKIKRWHTMHGLALNVDPDLSHFRHIVPCGIGDRPVGSMIQQQAAAEPGTAITLAAVKDVLLQCFAEVFAVDLVLPDAVKGR